jgi:hypothetical protein
VVHSHMVEASISPSPYELVDEFEDLLRLRLHDAFLPDDHDHGIDCVLRDVQLSTYGPEGTPSQA